MSITQRPWKKQPQVIAGVNRGISDSHGIEILWAPNASRLRLKQPFKSTPFGYGASSVVVNSYQFDRNLAIQNGSVVTIQALTYAPVAPSGGTFDRIFGTCSDTNNRRGYEIGIDGGTFVDVLFQTMNGGSRYSASPNFTYSGPEVAAKPLFLTFEVIRTSTDNTINGWAKVPDLPENVLSTPGNTTAPAFDLDTTDVSYPETGGTILGYGGTEDFSILQLVVRTGTLTAFERALWYADPWRYFAPLPRRIWAPAAGGPTTHPTTGALAVQSAAVAGVAQHRGLHPTTGALAVQTTQVAGAALRFRAHPTTGALAVQSAAVAGTAARSAGPVTHPSTGDLAVQSTAVAGTSLRFRAHPSTGALAVQPTTVSGAATRFVTHPSTGALAVQSAAVAGAALRTPVAGNTHPSSGALAVQAAQVAGAAVRRALHASSGNLAVQAAAVAGAAILRAKHTATGALLVQSTGVSGTANIRTTVHPTTGALLVQSVAVVGVAVHISNNPDIGLPPGWQVNRVLETVPNPNFGSAPYGTTDFTRWTYICTDENGQFVASSGSYSDCLNQSLTAAQSRTQQQPYNEAI